MGLSLRISEGQMVKIGETEVWLVRVKGSRRKRGNPCAVLRIQADPQLSISRHDENGRLISGSGQPEGPT